MTCDSVKVWADDSQWRAWRADLARFRKHGYSGWGSEGMWALTIYRLQRWVMRGRPAFAWVPLRVALRIVRKLLVTVTHISLPPEADIGPGLLIPHAGLIQIIPGAYIGADCAIHQICTIGAGPKPGMPHIGDHVYLGAHCCVLGGVCVGDGAKIGAGAVVISDVPPWANRGRRASADHSGSRVVRQRQVGGQVPIVL